ncbi:ATP-binding cassette domain-containing protein, partial [Streptomyces sp. MZ04]|uniref:ABC transporter ATP-binding protein n=1 Tax=Streptomyces sp. MZ04 TaxID=2559236 RepID=UPI00107ECC4A
MGLAWRADGRLVLLTGGFELVQAVGLGAGLLLLRHTVSALLATAPVAGAGSAAADRGGLAAVGVATLILLGMGTLGAALQLTAAAVQSVLRLKTERMAVGEVVAAAAAVDLEKFEDPAFHDRVERAVLAANRYAPLTLTLLFAGLRTGLMLVALAVPLVLMAWWLLPLLALLVVPTVRVALSRQRAMYGLQVHLTENSRTRYYLTQLLTGRDEAKEIRAFDLAGYMWQRLTDCYRQVLAETTALQRRFTLLGIGARLATDILLAAVAAALVVAAATGRLEAATAFTVLGALYLAGRNATATAALAGVAGGAMLYLDALREFTAPSTPLPPPVPVRSGFTSVEARKLSFTYPAGHRPALTDVSVRLGAGEVIALVGENGSGKTTLAKLLTGLYRPTGGQIVLDSTPVTDPADLRGLAAVLFQDYLRYKLTAKDNITLGRPERHTDTGAIETATANAGATTIISGLPHGYDTRLGTEYTGGVDLSTGQWQRIALARAFFRDAPLVVLDEPTAAMDPLAEADLFTAIRQLFTGRTVLLISHRFSSVRAADRIYVLKDGRIIEHGTHHDLLATDGVYADMFLTQAAAYLGTPTPD